jgi:hypothetical protein
MTTRIKSASLDVILAANGLPTIDQAQEAARQEERDRIKREQEIFAGLTGQQRRNFKRMLRKVAAADQEDSA